MQVFHPNIDLDGNICLNILREDWKPVLSINSVIYGLQFLFLVRNHVICSSADSSPARELRWRTPDSVWHVRAQPSGMLVLMRSAPESAACQGPLGPLHIVIRHVSVSCSAGPQSR